MTAQSIPSSPKPKPTRSLGCILGILATCVLGLVVVCLAGVVLLELAPDPLPTVTPVARTTRVSSTPSPRAIGAMTITSEGGQFSLEGLRVTVPRGAASQAVELKLSKYDEASPPGNASTTLSSWYELEGNFASIKGEIEIAIEIPRPALPKEGDPLVPILAAETAAKAPSFGNLNAQFPLPSRVDTTNSLVIGILKPNLFASLSSKSVPGLAMAPYGSLIQSAPLPRARVHAIQSFTRSYSRSIITAFVNYNSTTTEQLKTLLGRLDELGLIVEDQMGRLAKMGFPVGTVQYPIAISVQDLANNGGWNCGWFSCQLSIHQKFLLVPTGSDTDSELKAIVGHELLHAVQYYDDPSRPDFMNWMDEMHAVWNEPFAADVTDRIPDVVIKYKDFYRGSMTAAAAKSHEEARHHGYGSSIFLRFLTNKYGNALVPQSSIEMKRRAYASQPVAILNNVLQSNQTTSISNEWVRFMEAWFTQPETVWGAGLSPDPSGVNFDAKASVGQYSFLSSIKDVGDKNVSTAVPPPSLSRLAQGVAMLKPDGTWGALVNDSQQI